MPRISCHDYEDAVDLCSHFSWCFGQIRFQNILFSFSSWGWIPLENAISRCSTRGCFNFAYLHMHKHTTYVCVGCTHTHMPNSCFLTNALWHESTPVFLIFSHSFHTWSEGLPKDSPLSQWAAGTQDCGKWKSTINETVNNDRKMGSWVQLLSWLSFPGRDLGGRFEISAILMKYKERRS